MILKTLKSLEDLRKDNKKKIIGLCHGVFDIIHNGHVDHFNASRKKCDILIVSITGDKFVKKGPYQPYNSSIKRAKVLEALKFVDHVYINEDFTPIKLIHFLKPNLYFKGFDYLKLDLTGNLQKEIKAVKKNYGKTIITKTKIMSSTKILNNALFDWNEEQKKYLKKISSLRPFDYILDKLDKIEKLNINIIGEPIIDKYVHSRIIGLTSKDPALSGLETSNSRIPGGVISVATIASEFVSKVALFTYGNSNILKNFLNKNIRLFNLDSSQDIQLKTRYINDHRFQKIFQLTNFEKNLFSKRKKNKIIKILKKNLSDNLIICDFGNGLFKDDIIKFIDFSKVKKFINVQSNSLNYGYNLFTKYKMNNSIKYISLDKKEWELGFKKNELTDLDMKKYLNNQTAASVTLGKNGSLYYSMNKKFYSPVFIDKVIDTTGCGDAYFIITSLLKIVETDSSLIPFLGNVYAGMHSLNLGNSNITKKIEYIKNIKSLLNF
jgi:rfaE bifunctional protein nucleotidyltransferase chain/domain